MGSAGTHGTRKGPWIALALAAAVLLAAGLLRDGPVPGPAGGTAEPGIGTAAPVAPPRSPEATAIPVPAPAAAAGDGEPLPWTARLTGPEGEAIIGARLTLTPEGPSGRPLAAAPVDSGPGVYGLRPPPGSYLLRAEADGYAAEERSVRIPPEAGPRSALEIPMTRVFSVRGTVRDARNGAPIEAADVVLRATDGSRRAAGPATTGADGSFHLAGVFPGTYLVRMGHSGFVDPQRERAVEVPCGPLDIALQPTASIVVRLRPRVLDPAATIRLSLVPLRGVGSAISRVPSGEEREEGEFWLEEEGIFPTEYEVRAEVPGIGAAARKFVVPGYGETVEVELELAGETGIDLSLDDGTAMRGRALLWRRDGTLATVSVATGAAVRLPADPGPWEVEYFDDGRISARVAVTVPAEGILETGLRTDAATVVRVRLQGPSLRVEIRDGHEPAAARLLRGPATGGTVVVGADLQVMDGDCLVLPPTGDFRVGVVGSGGAPVPVPSGTTTVVSLPPGE